MKNFDSSKFRLGSHIPVGLAMMPSTQAFAFNENFFKDVIWPWAR